MIFSGVKGDLGDIPQYLCVMFLLCSMALQTLLLLQFHYGSSSLATVILGYFVENNPSIKEFRMVSYNAFCFDNRFLFCLFVFYRF
jgi:hypothetical protein